MIVTFPGTVIGLFWLEVKLMYDTISDTHTHVHQY